MTTPTDPIWYLLAEEARKKAKPMHSQERLAFTEGFLAACEAVVEDRDGTIAELLVKAGE